MPSANYNTTLSESLGRTQQTYDSQGVSVGEVITNAPRQLLEFTGVNNAGATRYIMLFDADAVPANGTVPKVAPTPVASGGAFTYTPPGGRLQFTTGMCWASS